MLLFINEKEINVKLKSSYVEEEQNTDILVYNGNEFNFKGEE
jgi:hypothetical protein